MATRALQQVVCYTAWNTSTNVYVTGDSANHSTSWCKDGTRAATTNATAEVDATNLPGLYKVTMTSTETDCIEGVLGGKSSTANVVLIPTMVAFDYLNTSAPATAGVPDVNVKNMNNVAATSITTINANQGTTQPINFTGTAGTALVKADAVDIAGAAVSTSTAQLGVNVVNWAGGAAPAPNVTGVPLVDLKYTLGTISPAAAGSVGIDWAQVANKTSTVALTNTTVGTVTTVTNQLTAAAIATGVWTDTTAGDFTTALSIGKSVMNGVTLGTGLTVANLTNLPAIPNNWITAAGITAAALNGKGDWLLASSYTAPPTTAQIATGVWTDTTAGDFTTALSVGKSLMNGVTLGTGLTVNALTNAATSGDLTSTMKTSVENAVWDATLASHLTAGSTGFALNAAGSAGDPWGTAIPGAYGAGTAGHRLGNIPDVAAGAAGGVFIAGSNAATTVNFTGNLSGSVGSVTGAVNSVTTGVTVTTNNDKTGYSITSNVKKNAAGRITFVMTDATTHAPKTGLTVASTVAIDGAAFGATVNSPTAVGNGVYTLVLAAGDTNGNDLMFRFTAAGADDLNLEYVTQP